jgi:hypothetical protein
MVRTALSDVTDFKIGRRIIIALKLLKVGVLGAVVVLILTGI